MFSKIFDEAEKGARLWGKETICELHRQIYDLLVVNLYNKNPKLLKQLIPILEKAYVCGIKMNRKMLEHKCSIRGWEEHVDEASVIKLRLLRKHLVEELERIRDCRNGNKG